MTAKRSELLDIELSSRGLPEKAYIDNSTGEFKSGAPVIAVKRGESGFYPIFTPLSAKELNDMEGATEAQVKAMQFGSIFGWDTPGAFPAKQEEMLAQAAARRSAAEASA